MGPRRLGAQNVAWEALHNTERNFGHEGEKHKIWGGPGKGLSAGQGTQRSTAPQHPHPETSTHGSDLLQANPLNLFRPVPLQANTVAGQQPLYANLFGPTGQCRFCQYRVGPDLFRLNLSQLTCSG